MELESRRKFLKIATAGISSLAITNTAANSQPDNILSEKRMGVLVDTTVCIGCRNCEYACKVAHNIPTNDINTYADRTVFESIRRPDIDALTVVNEYHNLKNPLLPVNVKIQCMHCDKPACVSACIVGALSKKEDGSVIWDDSKCIGCRYCMVACPFQIPSFEYFKAIEPEIRKCDFCYERKKEGQLPACVEICPVEALTFGQRSDIVRLAKDKIKRSPEKYINHLYGEDEVSGTSWVYLSNRSFYDLGFPKLGGKHAPGVSEAIQHGIFAYFVPPVLFYSLLGTVMWITKRKKEIEMEGGEE